MKIGPVDPEIGLICFQGVIKNKRKRKKLTQAKHIAREMRGKA